MTIQNKKKVNKSKNEYIWTCDFCGEEFKTKKESDKHELTCKKNKNREILLRIKLPDKKTIFVLVFIFLVIYLFTFAIANSYAKGNGLGKKYLTNPLNWFSEEIKNKTTSTPTPTPEVTPTPSPKPKTQTSSTNNNQSNQIECIGPDGKHFNTTMDECKKLADKWGKPLDYMTDCNIHPDCGGGTVKMSYSQCMKPCSGLPNKTNNSQVTSVPQNTTNNNSNKTAVFLTNGQYTIYCPAQNVGAVMVIDSTMKSKSMEWAKNYNDCADRFRISNSCWSSCKTTHTDDWNKCTAMYGYSGTEKDNCTNKVGDVYSSCISNCPSPSSACDYVYMEQKSLSSQINNLCK